jgi:signal transduction histidine kinase
MHWEDSMTKSDQSATSTRLDSVSGGHTTLAEARAVERDQRLLTISEIAKISVTEHVTQTMLQRLLTCLVETFEPAETGVLLLYDPAEEALSVQATHGYDLAKLEQIRIAPGEARCGRAFQMGQPEVYSTPETIAAAIENMTQANRDAVTGATIGLREPHSAVCIPLLSGETKVGVLMLENLHDANSFARADLPFLQTVADLVALSVEGARLRENFQSAQALSEANRLKAELISALAHEMRTPLTSIKGYSTALLMEEVTFDPETQREFLQFIDEECDVLQTLIHDLLESSIIDAGLLRLEPQPVQLPRLAKNVTDDIARRTGIHRFLLDFPEHFPILDADPDRVVQVLRNLLDNAVKYSPEGGLIVVRGEVREDEVVVSVADQGVGLTPEHLNRLFEKFFRAKSSLGRHVVGSGLGLPISRTIVESHGGRIWAESQVGQGTTLFFALPLEGQSQELAEREEGQHE